MICPICSKPIYMLGSPVPYLYGAFCQCATKGITIRLTASTNEFVQAMEKVRAAAQELSQRLSLPERTIPKAFYDAFSDEELSL